MILAKVSPRPSFSGSIELSWLLALKNSMAHHWSLTRGKFGRAPINLLKASFSLEQSNFSLNWHC
jgi:hypothetical protein